MSSKRKQRQSQKGYSNENYGNEFDKEKRRHERRREMKRRMREEPEDQMRRSFKDYHPADEVDEEDWEDLSTF